MRRRFPDLCMTSKAALRLLLDFGFFDDVESMMQEGQRLYPGSAHFVAGHAEVASRQGNLQEALCRCEVLRKRFSYNADGYTIAATCLASLGRHQEAEAMIGQAVRKFPDDNNVLIEYARQAERRQDWQEAVKRWQVVRSGFDNPSTALGIAGPLRLAGRLAEAEEIVADVCLRLPGNHWAFIELAGIAAAKGEANKEAECWKSVRKVSPFLALGYLEGVKVARRAGREVEANEILSEAVTKFNSNLDVHLEYARSAQRRGDLSAAIERWALVRKRFPECVEVREAVGGTRGSGCLL
jgi:tetratricopeptide (TPR) repeat protein